MTAAARSLTALLMMLAALSISTATAWAAVPPGGDGSPGDAESAAEAAVGEQECRGVRNVLPRCVAAAARDRVGDAVGAGLSMATSGMFEQLYDWVVGGATWLLRKLVSLMDSSTRPNLTGGWFGRSYGLMASLAVLLVLPLLMVATITAVLRQDWSSLARCYLVYLPAAGIGTGIAIPLTDIGLDVTDWMSSLFLDSMRGDIQAFLDTVSRALHSPAGDAAPELPLFLAFIAAVIIALGAFAVWVELVLRTAGIYVATFFLPLGFAALVWPATRSWFGRLVKTVVALILSKFVIVAVFALAAAALGNLGGAGFAGVITGAALMLMAAFSPLVLFRLADVAGGDVAAAFTGATQGRTSPVPVPDARRSAASVYGRIMRDRTAGGMATAKPALATAGGSAGVAGAGGVGLVGAAAATPGRVGRQASDRASYQGQPGDSSPSAGREGQAAATAERSDNDVGGHTNQPPRRQGDIASPSAATGSVAQPQRSGDARAARSQSVQPAAEAPIAQPARPLPSPPPSTREGDR